MKKIKIRFISFLLAFQLFANLPVMGFITSYSAESFAYQDALIPIESFAVAVAIGSGIVASQSQEAIKSASGVIARAIAKVKAQACNDANTAFRVVKGGKSEKPSNGDDKNVNKWFVRGAGAVAAGKLVADMTASSRMMEAISQENGYENTSYKTGIVSYDDILSFSNIKSISEQISYEPIKKQLNLFIKYFEEDGNDLNDYFYLVTAHSFSNEGYPGLYITCFKKNDNLSYIVVDGNLKEHLTYKSFSYGNSSFSGWSLTPSNYGFGRFFNSDDLILTLNNCLGVSLSSWQTWASPPSGLSYNHGINTSVYYNSFSTTNNLVYGFIPASKVLYELTNNTYKSNESLDVNFPNWVQSSIETLNGNMEALNLAISNLTLPSTWSATQPDIQAGTSSANVINQYINYASNPETAPDPGDLPGTDPEPEPEPQPDDEPASEDALKEAGSNLLDWSLSSLKLPDGFFDKLPFSIPYDVYLLLKSLFPSSKSNTARKAYSVYASSNGGGGYENPTGLTISSHYEASGITTKSASMESNKWVKTAPIINLDIHWKYHDVSGQVKTIDIVKKVDLKSISYFAMIIYISIYIIWFFILLGWIMSSFKG